MYTDTGKHRQLLVNLCEHVWETGSILSQMILTIVVLISKRNSDKFGKIGLLEIIWKFLERVLDERLSEIGFRVLFMDSAPRGAGAISSYFSPMKHLPMKKKLRQ